jgi:hypothetical protein
MNIPPEVKPALWGVAGGAVALAILGFSWGGWVTGGTAEAMAKERASATVVSVLAPICVDQFQRQANAAASLVELKKASSWQQGAYVEKGGWATMPGSNSADSAVAKACAETLANGKVAAN